MHPFKCPDIRIDETHRFCAQGQGDPKAEEHVLALARFLYVKPRLVQLVVDVTEAWSIIPLNQVISDPVLLKEIPQYESLFFRGFVQTEDDLRKVSGRLQLSQDILKDGDIIFVRVLAGEQRNNQYRLFPLGMEPEPSSQMLSILLEYVECGQLESILGEIGNSLTSTLDLSGWETKENPANCQLPLTFMNNSIPLDTLGVIARG